MPELPEVETIRRGLEKVLPNLAIEEVEIKLPYLIKYPSVEEFKEKIKGKKFENIGRRGKYLLLYLSGGYVLVAHLRMTGQFNYASGEEEVPKHTYVIFYLSNGHQLRFIEPRRFGTLHLVREDELYKAGGLVRLGPEPIGEGFTLNYLQEILKRRKGKIKAALLNQEIIAGIGNIYADEALFRAGVDPRRNSDSLSDEEISRLYESIKEVIRLGIKYRGTSVQSYFDVEGKKGQFQEHLQVYRRTGEPCVKCGAPIERIEVAGRGTHFCPYCQK
jgi:formamidopyrimidine-DNA glycosylase